MHFFGGVTIGFSYYLLLKEIQKKAYFGKSHQFVFFIFTISLVALTVLIWEFGEFTLDFVYGGFRQKGLADTMADLFLGLSGSVLGYVWVKK